ncbi:cupin domain-containing protein [Nocardiopsis tropica]|uniref:Cupin domain-containing protein n=1 Tax=Nocardiopsis tropica TaxID=109330 RepID=A0ABU7KMZ4_9ACTN|nr:cupin domain-containing protein [Nocardiopsis umidischolae]MEE2050660.1 cupin domain-containing protein [Nocardiopsis umidischolae]
MIIRTSQRQRLTADNRPHGCPADSAGGFVIRADGTARFDRHFHDVDEFWFVSAGSGTITLDGAEHRVGTGDIVLLSAGVEHDITAVGEELHVFWLTTALPDGQAVEHLHRSPEDAIKHPVPVCPHPSKADRG